MSLRFSSLVLSARKILEILRPPSETGIIRDEMEVRAKNKLKIGKDKADGWLAIQVQNGLAERYESVTDGKRKTALFRRVYE